MVLTFALQLIQHGKDLRGAIY